MIVEETEASTKQCWKLGGNCLGSGCMAWNFLKERVRKETSSSIIYSTNYKYIDTTRGYCAGLPSEK